MSSAINTQTNLEKKIHDIGLDLWKRIQGEAPGHFQQRLLARETDGLGHE